MPAFDRHAAITTPTSALLIAQGHEYAERAGYAKSAGMALVYLRKARNLYSDGGRDDLAGLIEGMMERVG